MADIQFRWQQGPYLSSHFHTGAFSYAVCDSAKSMLLEFSEV